MSYAVYRLIDPRTQSTFYVGVTDNLASRYVQHLRCSDKNTRKNGRIQEIKDAHFLPIPDTLEIIEERTLALKRERYWIQHYRYLGADLLNAVFPAGEHEPAGVVEETEKVPPTTKLIGLTYQEAAKLEICLKKQVRVSDLKAAVKRGELKPKSDGSLARFAVETWVKLYLGNVSVDSGRAKASDEEILEFIAENPGKTTKDVAAHFGISERRVYSAKANQTAKVKVS